MTRVLPAGLSYPCAVQFDDHEIWGAPVQAPVSPAQEHVSRPAATATDAAGRLYKSAGCEESVDAIVALPGRRHTMAHPLPHAFPHADAPVTSSAPAPSAPVHRDDAAAAVQAPITINSRLPRRPEIEDPAIAEVLSAPVAPPVPPAPRHREHSGFTSWFRASAVRSAAPVADPHAWADPSAEAPAATPAPAPRAERRPAEDWAADAAALAPTPRVERRPAEDWSAIAPVPATARRGASLPLLTSRGYALALFAVTTVSGIIDTRGAGSFGSLTGVVFLLASVAGAWVLDPDSRWAGRVIPTYALIAAIVVAGQFSSVAPGRSIIGQALLVLTGLISVAPWLAAATVITTVLARLRRA